VHKSSTRKRAAHRYPGRESAAQQFGDEGARHDGAFVNVKPELPQPGFAGEIGRRCAFAHPPPQYDEYRIEFAWTQLPFEHGIEFAERQLERVQDEVDRFVAGVKRAVTEGEAGVPELRDRLAQYRAQRQRPVAVRVQAGNSRRSSTCR
jgi:hypothetical protein